MAVTVKTGGPARLDKSWDITSDLPTSRAPNISTFDAPTAARKVLQSQRHHPYAGGSRRPTSRTTERESGRLESCRAAYVHCRYQRCVPCRRTLRRRPFCFMTSGCMRCHFLPSRGPYQVMMSLIEHRIRELLGLSRDPAIRYDPPDTAHLDARSLCVSVQLLCKSGAGPKYVCLMGPGMP